MCHPFFLTLEGQTRKWYKNLRSESVKHFNQLCEQYVTTKNPSSLLLLKQRNEETLKRYHKVVMEVGAFTHLLALEGKKRLQV